MQAKKEPWYKKLGIVLLFLAMSPVFLFLGGKIFLSWLKSRFIERSVLLRRVKDEWLPRGIFILFVYSDNEEWKMYAEEYIIPRITSHAAILNWSKRKEWIDSGTLEALLFRNFVWGYEPVWRRNYRRGGGQWYNHMAIVFNPWEKPVAIDFWKGFKEYTFGKPEKLREAESRLFGYLEQN